MKKKYIAIIGILIVLIFVIGYFSNYNNDKLILGGTYQSEDYPNDILQMTFSDGKFYEYKNNILIDSGEYKQSIDQVYLLKSETTDNFFVLQEDNNFYYYSKNISEKKVYHMLLIDRVPTFYPDSSSVID